VNEAIYELLKATGPEPKLVILLTDGRTNTVNGKFVGDGNSKAVNALLDSSKAAKDKGIVIHGINYGKDVDNATMRQVAESTEGRFYYAPRRRQSEGRLFRHRVEVLRSADVRPLTCLKAEHRALERGEHGSTVLSRNVLLRLSRRGQALPGAWEFPMFPAPAIPQCLQRHR